VDWEVPDNLVDLRAAEQRHDACQELSVLIWDAPEEEVFAVVPVLNPTMEKDGEINKSSESSIGITMEEDGKMNK
jgi:hypothetical protein